LTASGLDTLVADGFRPLRGRRVALLANQASVDSDWRHAADLLAAAPGVGLVRLLGPEHGLRGEAQDMIGVGSGVDPGTGLPVVSLYGDGPESLRPRPEDLDGIDDLVADLRDIGSRYYTFAATLFYCMDAAAGRSIRVVVLDRPNLLGRAVEGPTVSPGFESFVGAHPLPIRPGLTLGELALLYRSDQGLDLEVEVVRCDPAEVETVWVPPSPNMPAPSTAAAYPGGCLIEGTNLSEGRGTTRPFELWGAPWLAPHLEFMAGALAPVCPRLRPCSFRPTFHKHAGQICHGLHPHPAELPASALRLYLGYIALARHLAPGDFRWRTEVYEFLSEPIAFDLLMGSSREREAIESISPADLAGIPGWLGDLAASWRGDEEAFRERRRPHLIYPDGIA
jgi:uncharacterized protein YbbC (DUF1343 family)